MNSWADDAFPDIWTHSRQHKGALALIAAPALLGVAEQALGLLVSFGAYSALTCLQTPCPVSLDASQPELLYNLWLLPTSLAYNFLGHAPHMVLSTYPFGAPPPGRPGWQGDLLDGMRYFWFVFLPDPKVVLVVGALLVGAAGAALTALKLAVGLLPFSARAIVSDGQADQPALAAGAVLRRASIVADEPGD